MNHLLFHFSYSQTIKSFIFKIQVKNIKNFINPKTLLFLKSFLLHLCKYIYINVLVIYYYYVK